MSNEMAMSQYGAQTSAQANVQHLMVSGAGLAVSLVRFTNREGQETVVTQEDWQRLTYNQKVALGLESMKFWIKYEDGSWLEVSSGDSEDNYAAQSEDSAESKDTAESKEDKKK